jgi:hypothetical protein
MFYDTGPPWPLALLANITLGGSISQWQTTYSSTFLSDPLMRVRPYSSPASSANSKKAKTHNKKNTKNSNKVE